MTRQGKVRVGAWVGIGMGIGAALGVAMKTSRWALVSVGLADGPDGSIYVSDDSGGRIHRILYRQN